VQHQVDRHVTQGALGHQALQQRRLLGGGRLAKQAVEQARRLTGQALHARQRYAFRAGFDAQQAVRCSSSFREPHQLQIPLRPAVAALHGPVASSAL